MPVGACREGVSVAKTGWRDIGERRNIAFENQKSHHNRERQDTTPSLCFVEVNIVRRSSPQ
jgi:hypothetical protein